MKSSLKFVTRVLLSVTLGWLAAVVAKAVYFTDWTWETYALAALAAVALFFTAVWPVSALVAKFFIKTEERFAVMPLNELVSTLAGGLVGLAAGALISVPFTRLPYGFGFLAPFCALVLLAHIGVTTGHKRGNDFARLKNGGNGRAKILDTSVIIDGRILDIIQTGFVEGKIIVPNFVLDELRHIADSSDPIRKGRGRQGLDTLNKIREQQIIPVEIVDWRPERFMDVDSRLLQMAGELDAFIVTNDYNLNRVAEFQMVSVLNINELSNALKAVVVPGQEIIVSVVKVGKEAEQGVAYLNDGTMVVIEDGRKYVGEEISVSVTSILQTAAGRMIFSKPMD